MTDVCPTVLIVDDDLDFATATADFAKMRGFEPSLARSLEQTRQFMERKPSDLTLLDLSLPDGSSFDLLDQLDASECQRIAIMTDEPTIESEEHAMSLPVLDYLVKPLCPIRFDALLSNASARAQGPTIRPAMGGLVVGCAAMRGVVEDLARIAPTTASVLLAGESGTGKELVAHALHDNSGRRGRFVAVNCGAIAPDLLASHLFGHERGSFTGAANRHVGYFEQANHGTLFLDEITEMSPGLQVYLLRVLETRQLTRVGGAEQIGVDVRVVAATNCDPLEAIDNGMLREDLFYRLADFIVTLPPLRDREDDALLLSHLFVERLNEEHQCSKRLAPGAERVLMQH
ncbi:MAG: sigma-54-dependent transcriptional regulator, partial [Lysobacter sp.]